jgi:hypothetical protein
MGESSKNFAELTGMGWEGGGREKGGGGSRGEGRRRDTRRDRREPAQPQIVRLAEERRGEGDQTQAHRTPRSISNVV